MPTPPFNSNHPTVQLVMQHHHAGRFADAEPLYQQLLSQYPDHPQLLYAYGMLLHHTHRHDQALHTLHRAAQLAPANAHILLDLGNIHLHLRQLDLAIRTYQQALTLDPQFTHAWINLGLAQFERANYDQALAAYSRAAQIDPAFPPAHNGLGNVLLNLGQQRPAIQAYEKAIVLNYAPSFVGMASAYYQLGEFDAAESAARQAIARISPPAPPPAEAFAILASILKDQGRLDEAIAASRQAITLNPNLLPAHSNLLYILHLHPASTPASLLQEHQLWHARHAAPLAATIAPHTNTRDPDRPLRIGYVSPDFCNHPVGRFVATFLAHHDPRNFHITCYATIPRPDPVADRIRTLTGQWRDARQLSDAQLADLIRADQIDILIDLTMHMEYNRLLTFARKPAPIQLTYLAYCGTTGLPTIDYRLSDPFIDPPAPPAPPGADDSCYSEKTLRLPDTFWCYEPPASPAPPPVNPAPVHSTGHLTFGSLNNFAKVTPQALHTWAALLQQIPNSHLLLHCAPGAHRNQVLAIFAQHSVSPDRIEFLPRLALADYFQTYHRIDIALDTFPCAGGTTSCDTFWMGVPLITLRGLTAIGRGGISILSNLLSNITPNIPDAGLWNPADFIADSPADYIRLAAALATDLPKLDRLRASLRPRMQASHLMDAPRFTRALESAFRTIWHQWCAAP